MEMDEPEGLQLRDRNGEQRPRNEPVCLLLVLARFHFIPNQRRAICSPRSPDCRCKLEVRPPHKHTPMHKLPGWERRCAEHRLSLFFPPCRVFAWSASARRRRGSETPAMILRLPKVSGLQVPGDFHALHVTRCEKSTFHAVAFCIASAIRWQPIC